MTKGKVKNLKKRFFIAVYQSRSDFNLRSDNFYRDHHIKLRLICEDHIFSLFYKILKTINLVSSNKQLISYF